MSPLTEPTRLTLAKGQPVPNDPSFAFNSLLLHGNGTNGSTVIIDSSGSPKTVTAVGNAQISTAVTDPFGNSTRGVLAFDGSGDGLNITKTADFDFGTADFTIEAWIYFASGNFKIIDAYKGYTANTSGNYFDVLVNSSRYIRISTSVSGSFASITATDQQLALNTWQHVAVSKASGTVRLFVNGVQATTTGSIASTVNGGTTRINVGYTEEFNDNYLNGYIDELRITKGVARYTSNFTPPTAPFPDF